MTGMESVVYLSLVTASISFTVTETKLFELFRKRMHGWNSFFGKLFSCGYCLGHWVALALEVAYRPRLFGLWLVLDYILTAIVIAWLGGFQWGLMCLLMDKTGK
ncbi:MAG TPA: DUF1360 domain-containing protein [Thermoplasmatales archaeon]|nr:DUF1360 domain-containing protein [Thermoplasmatales archaeon]